MARTRCNADKGVDRTTGWVCAAWLIGAAGTTQALAQSKDPFNASTASSDQDKVRVSEHMTVDLHVNDEDLVNVLQMLSIQSERNIVASNKVSATVSADLYDVTFYEALDAILTVNGYGYVEKGNFIYVYTLEEIQQLEQAQRRPVAKVLRLNYLSANDAAEFVSPLLSEVGQIKTNGDVDTFTIPDDSPIGDETFALEATLVVVDYPENVEEIEKLVEQLDTRPQQVLVEATILQTQINEANAFGVDFSIIGDLDFTDFIETGGPLSVANSLIQGGTGASGEGLSPADNNALGITSTAGRTTGPSTFKLGIVQDDVTVFLRLLDEVTDFTVLSNPKVLSLNRQPARVLVGAKIGFLNSTATETSTTQTVEFLDTGTQLAFRPFVAKDGFIRMELRPSVSEGVIRQATGGNGATVSIPDEITQEVTTNVIVRDGSTIVLGGLFKETTTVTRTQVPVVGDIPIIGAAFRGHDDSTERDEIIFLITPTIMNDNALLEQGQIAGDYVDAVRSGARRQLLPFSRDRMTAALNVEAERLAADGEVDKALWKLRRSLELNANQPEALRMRERLMGEKDREPSRSILRRVIEEAMQEEGAEAFVPPAPADADEAARAPLAELFEAAFAPDDDAPDDDAPVDDAPEGEAPIEKAGAAGQDAAGAQPSEGAAQLADVDEQVEDDGLDFNFDWPEEADAGLDAFDEPAAEPAVEPAGDPDGVDDGGAFVEDESDFDFMRFPSAAEADAEPGPALPIGDDEEAQQPAKSTSLLDDLIRKAAERSKREQQGAADPEAGAQAQPAPPATPQTTNAPAPKGESASKGQTAAPGAPQAPEAQAEAPDWFNLFDPPADAPLPDAAPTEAEQTEAPFAPKQPAPAQDESDSSPQARAEQPAPSAMGPFLPEALASSRADGVDDAAPSRNGQQQPSASAQTTRSRSISDGGSTPHRLPTLDPADFGRATTPDAPAFTRLSPARSSRSNQGGVEPITRPAQPLPPASLSDALTRTGRGELDPPAYFDPFTHLPNDPFDWERSLAEVEELAKRRREEMRLVSPWEVKSLPSQWIGPAWVFDPMFPYLSWSLAPGAPFFLPADPAQWPEGLAGPDRFPTLKGTWKQVQGPLAHPDERDGVEESKQGARITEVGPDKDEDEPKR